tara:strand:- start:385 stop:558 length:174 start_codon:yes stop_codon:yes gene_type:complete
MKKHNYHKQLFNIAKEVSEGEPRIHYVSVAHDDWCSFLKNNKNKCNCSPEVQKGVSE